MDGELISLKILELAGLRFGEGLPKICVPLVGTGMPALLREAQYAAALPADLYEWRADHFFGDPLDALPDLRKELGKKPLLCTVRTKGEGGEALLSPEEYEELLTALLNRGGFQLLDIELSQGEDRVKRLVSLAQSRGVGTVVSKHDFDKTPPAGEIRDTLLSMKGLGADLPKYAVTPQNAGDVLALLAATWEASERIGPVVTMSMGDLGKLTRVSGAVFGSCLTFGAGQDASAPGQINAEDLKAILEDLNPRP